MTDTDRKLMPAWKLVDCPKCRSLAGEPCFRPVLGASGRWERVSAHAARKMKAIVRAAAALGEQHD